MASQRGHSGASGEQLGIHVSLDPVAMLEHGRGHDGDDVGDRVGAVVGELVGATTGLIVGHDGCP